MRFVRTEGERSKILETRLDFERARASLFAFLLFLLPISYFDPPSVPENIFGSHFLKKFVWPVTCVIKFQVYPSSINYGKPINSSQAT